MKVLYTKQSLIILPIGLRVDNIKLAIVGIVPKSQLELYINYISIYSWNSFEIYQNWSIKFNSIEIFEN
jgi:hypothetical protein